MEHELIQHNIYKINQVKSLCKPKSNNTCIIIAGNQVLPELGMISMFHGNPHFLVGARFKGGDELVKRVPIVHP